MQRPGSEHPYAPRMLCLLDLRAAPVALSPLKAVTALPTGLMRRPYRPPAAEFEMASPSSDPGSRRYTPLRDRGAVPSAQRVPLRRCLECGSAKTRHGRWDGCHPSDVLLAARVTRKRLAPRHPKRGASSLSPVSNQVQILSIVVQGPVPRLLTHAWVRRSANMARNAIDRPATRPMPASALPTAT
mgnify:CR=1 FL=1